MQMVEFTSIPYNSSASAMYTLGGNGWMQAISMYVCICVYVYLICHINPRRSGKTSAPIAFAPVNARPRFPD